MTLDKRTKITAYLALGAYSVLLAVFNVQTPSLVLRIAGFFPLAIVLLFVLYDKFLWFRAPLLWFAHRPYVAGTWRGKLTSYRRDNQDRPITTDHDIVIIIRQEFLTVSVTLVSEQSKSRSSAAQIVELQAEDFSLMYQYANEPKMAFREGSPIHTGGCSIEVSGRSPKCLTGEYWTARDTRGTFEVTLINRKHAGTFLEAVAMEEKE